MSALLIGSTRTGRQAGLARTQHPTAGLPMATTHSSLERAAVGMPGGQVRDSQVATLNGKNGHLQRRGGSAGAAEAWFGAGRSALRGLELPPSMSPQAVVRPNAVKRHESFQCAPAAPTGPGSWRAWWPPPVKQWARRVQKESEGGLAAVQPIPQVIQLPLFCCKVPHSQAARLA